MTTASSRRRDAMVTAPIVLLFLAGYVKQSPALDAIPLDLTLLAAAWLGLVAINEAIRSGVLRGLAPLVVVVMAFLLGVVNSPVSAYAAHKVQLLFLLTLPAAFAAAFIVTTSERAWWLARWTALGGLGMGLLLVVAPSSADLYGRYATEGGDTISIGRGCGAAIVAVLALMVGRKVRWPLGLAGIAVLSGIVLGSGSRGPLVGTVVGLVVVALARPGFQRVKYVAAVAALVGIAGPWLLSRTNAAALDRILLLFSPDRGESVTQRQYLYGVAAHLGAIHPFGVGWGGFQSYSPLQNYPHNLGLEVYAEAGWFAAGALAVLVTVSLVRLMRQASDPAMGAVLGLLAFWLTNAMFSGDVNDNRAALALLAVGLTLPKALVTPADRSPVASSRARRPVS